jgi:hypothetical protein
MNICAHVENQIHLCIRDLNELVMNQGCALTHPEVVTKSKELDQLILCAMNSQSTKKFDIMKLLKFI